ncbi:MAG: hypothetical protein KF777_22970 [Planctomycetaceae bacterium]|nr:hypothetical protein [Planctomycetaceae bacterium]
MSPSKWLLFILFPPVAVLAAMFVTDFPHVTNLEGTRGDFLRAAARSRQITAISTALVTSYIIVATCRPGIAWIMIVASHVLWVQPIWVFHHISSLGVFAWIVTSDEEGSAPFPTIIGFPLTIAAHFAVNTFLEFMAVTAEIPEDHDPPTVAVGSALRTIDYIESPE